MNLNLMVEVSLRYPAAKSVSMEAMMNEDVLNMEIRKFLKHVGVTSQRVIESAVRDAVASGKLKGKKSVSASVTLTIAGLDIKHEIADDIAFE
jgi:Family of unknown function (DUF6494)